MNLNMIKGEAPAEVEGLLEEAKKFKLQAVVIAGVLKDGSFYLSTTHLNVEFLKELLESSLSIVDDFVSAKNTQLM